MSRHDEQAAVLASRPAFVAMGGGAPGWLRLTILSSTVMAGLAVLLWQLAHPPTISTRTVAGFLLTASNALVMPAAFGVGLAIWRGLAWRLRKRFPDRLLVYANETGIGVGAGAVIPFSAIRRIDGYRRRRGCGDEVGIEIDAGGRWPAQVSLDLPLDPPEAILAALRERALAGGADLPVSGPSWR